MGRLKIALVILHADPARGGAERYTHDLATALASSHDVSVLATSFGDQADGVKQVALDSRGLTRTRRYHRFLHSMEMHLVGHPYDIVHAMLPVRRCDLYHPHAGLATRSVNRATGLKRLNNALNPRRTAFAKVERQLLERADAPVLLCLSAQMKADVIADGLFKPVCAAVLFNAVDLAKFDHLRFPHEPARQVRALMIAQDFARKGLKPAIEAIAASPAWHLTVVGKDDATPYRQLAASLGAENRIIFVGPMADVRPMYQQADVFLLPTHHDPCSLVVLEALAMGVPVISTKANGACEIMTDGEHGFVIDDANDVVAIKRSLEILSDPQRRMVMRAACLSLRERLSFAEHVRSLERIYSLSR